VILDGGLATALEVGGHDLSDRLWSARLLRDDPAAIEAAHTAFFVAGAQIAITASYQASFEGFAAVGIDADEAAALIRRSVEIARRARDRFAREADRPLRVAGSVGPYGAMLAGGQEYTGEYGAVTSQQLRGFHRRRVAELVAAGADMLAIETIPSIREAHVLVEVVAEFPQTPAWISFSCRNDTEIADGTPFAEAARVAAGAASVFAVGVNCTAPRFVQALLTSARDATTLPFVVYPNDGRVWDAATRAWCGCSGDGFPAATLAAWRRLGAELVGGCCGVTPAGISVIRARLT
jgi:homocysteine S-methyltransferase